MCLFCWTQRKIFWRMRETEQFWIIVLFFPTMEVNGAPKQPDYKLSSKYLPLCSEQTHSYRFGTTWGWVNDDRIIIFGWTVPLRLILCSRVTYLKCFWESELYCKTWNSVSFLYMCTSKFGFGWIAEFYCVNKSYYWKISQIIRIHFT